MNKTQQLSQGGFVHCAFLNEPVQSTTGRTHCRVTNFSPYSISHENISLFFCVTTSYDSFGGHLPPIP